MSNQRNLPIVEVHWDDACSVKHWRDPREYDSIPVLPCTSVGYLLRKTSVDLVIVQSQNAEQAAEALIIPIHNVKEVRYMKSSKKTGKGGKKC